MQFCLRKCCFALFHPPSPAPGYKSNSPAPTRRRGQRVSNTAWSDAWLRLQKKQRIGCVSRLLPISPLIERAGESTRQQRPSPPSHPFSLRCAFLLRRSLRHRLCRLPPLSSYGNKCKRIMSGEEGEWHAETFACLLACLEGQSYMTSTLREEGCRHQRRFKRVEYCKSIKLTSQIRSGG